MGRPAKHPIQELDGVRYYRKPSGYFKADHKHGGEYLHRAVWKRERGPIPAGFDVHHKNEDPADCAVGNLELRSKEDHGRLHGHQRDKDELRALLAAARPAAADANRALAGTDAAADRSRRGMLSRPMQRYRCVQCEGEYEARAGSVRRGFCGAKCQQAARRASGVDNEQRVCAHCDQPFTANKHTATRYCGKRCGALASR